jgi:hypothetical protein
MRAQACSPSAQVKAAATHAWRLKRKQRKKNLKPVYGGRGNHHFFLEASIRLVASLPLLRRWSPSAHPLLTRHSGCSPATQAAHPLLRHCSPVLSYVFLSLSWTNNVIPESAIALCYFVNFRRGCSWCPFRLLGVPNWPLYQEQDYVTPFPSFRLRIDRSLMRSAPPYYYTNSLLSLPALLPSLVRGWLDSTHSLFAFSYL